MYLFTMTNNDASTQFVEGFASFPGEISGDIVKLLYPVRLSQKHFSILFDEVWNVVYEGKLDSSILTGREFFVCTEFRRFLQRCETSQAGPGRPAVHVIANTNTGRLLTFINSACCPNECGDELSVTDKWWNDGRQTADTFPKDEQGA